MTKYKIKDNVDLNILKKYPFEVEDSFCFSHSNQAADKHFQVVKHTREVKFLNGEYPFGKKIFNMLRKDNLLEVLDEI